MRRSLKYFGGAIALAMIVVATWFRLSLPAQEVAQPILVITNSAAPNKFGSYLPEILKAEGLKQFTTADLGAVTASTLSGAAVVVLAETPLTASQASLMAAYVAGGGRLVAMRPDSQLYATLGVTATGSSTTNGYVLIDQTGPGAGLQSITLPFRGTATHYQPANGASVVATLYSDASTTTNRPAVIRYGNTATFAFDIARSTVYSRQGDPANAFERDTRTDAFRTTDVFYEAIDIDRMSVPHADVLMRLFARMITELAAEAMPLPRLWYFPGTSRTAMIVTSDDHLYSGSQEATAYLAFLQTLNAHASVYLSRWIAYPNGPDVAAWRAAGHSVGVHPFGAEDGVSLSTGFATVESWAEFKDWLPIAPTGRNHSVEWLGWVDGARIAAAHNLRMDLSYYPLGPAVTRPDNTQGHGFITGSGLPMKFIDENGVLLPIYQQVTAITDEQLLFGDFSEHLTTEQALAITRQMIDDSQAGGYSALTALFHIDAYLHPVDTPWVQGTLQYAAGLGVPLLSADEWLAFTETRDATEISDVVWLPSSGRLNFNVKVPVDGRTQSLLVPASYGGEPLTAIRLDGVATSWTPLTASGRAMAAVPVTPTPLGTARAVTAVYGNQPNNAPTAIDDTAATIVNASVLIDPLANDSDIDGDALTVSVFPPTAGVASVVPGSTLVQYTPPPAFCGNASFGYTVSDGRGGSANASVTVAISCGGAVVTQTTWSQFASCSEAQFTRTRATMSGDGSIRLAGQLADEYSGGTLNPQWVSGTWGGAPWTAVPSGGTLTFGDQAGAYFVRSAAPAPVTNLEFTAQFTAAPFEEIGFGALGYANARYLLFSTGPAGDALYARSNMGPDWGNEQTTLIGAIPAGLHTYRIEKVAGIGADTIRYLIDGALVASHSVDTVPPLYVYQEAGGQTLPPLTIDSIELAPAYAAVGTYDSCVLDAGTTQPWTSVSWSGTVPAGTAVSVSTRTSSDGTAWSAWSAPLTTSGQAIASPPGRYLQYQLRLSTSVSSATPEIASITFTHGAAPNHAPVAAPDTATTIPDQAVVVAVTANDLDIDGDPLTVTSAVPSAGTAAIVAGTFVRYTPAPGFCGAATFTYTVDDGRGGSSSTTATVNVDCSGGILTHTTLGQFSSCSEAQFVGTRAVADGDGAIRLAGLLNDDYSSGTLGPQWVSGTWAGGPFTPVPSGGMLTFGDAAGAYFVRSALTYDVTALEFTAQFTASPFEEVGFGALGYANARYLLFSTGANGDGLYARSNMGPDWGNEQTTLLGAIPSGLHTYRIERTAGGSTDTIRYLVDGVQVASHTVAAVPSLYVYQEAGGQSLPPLTIDRIELAPAYAANGLYRSCVLDQGATLPWMTANWSATLPVGTSVAMATRTSADGLTWSAWSAPQSISGLPVTSPAGRYLQYELQLSSSAGLATPLVTSVWFAHPGDPLNHPPVAVTDSATTSIEQPVVVDVLANDTDADGDTLTVTPGAASAGTVTLVPGGLLRYSPPLSFCGTATFGYSVSDGRGGSAQATATVTVTCTGETFARSTLADFASCSEATFLNIRAAAVGDGAIRLAGVLNDAYGGQILSAQWVAGTWSGAPFTPVPSGGKLTFGDSNGAYFVRSAQAYPVTALEFTGEFTAAPWQEVGFGALNYEGAKYLLFTTAGGTDTLYAHSNMGPDWSNEQSTTIGAIPAGPHVYRIERVPGSGTDTIRYLIDGALVATHVVATVPDLYVYQEAGGQTSPALVIDDIDLAPAYAVSGQYDSCVIDGGVSQTWRAASWVATLPAGTTVSLATRSSIDGSAWSGWSSPLTVNGATIGSPAGRFLQYRLFLTTADPAVTPIVESVTIGADSGLDTRPPVVSTVVVSEVAATSVRLSWTTDEPAISRVEYGPTTAYGQVSASDASLVTSHTRVLTGLTPLTTYHYRIVSEDAGGHRGETADGTFVTGAPSLSIDDISVTEGTGGPVTATFTVTLSPAAPVPVTVSYATQPGTAGAADFTAVSGTLTFAAGTTSLPIGVSISGDAVSEAAENFVVTLANPTNATIAKGQGTGVIVDNDPLPSLSIADATVTETNSGTVAATFIVTLSAASEQSIQVAYATANGTALAGSDYVATSNTLAFTPGTVSRSLTVTVNGDTALEPNEVFFVNLSNPVNATISKAQGVGTILNNDPPVVTIAPVSVPEGNSGTTNAVFTVTLSQPTTSLVSMNFATSAGTASAGSDYVQRSGSLQIPAGQTSATISVTVNGDVDYEQNETFTVTLSALSSTATFGTSAAAATITNDDAPPSISIGDVTVTEGSTATFMLTLSAASYQTIQVGYATANGTGSASVDYSARSGTASFGPGARTQTITVPTISNSTPQANRTFFVNLSGAVNASIADAQAVATIADNDGVITVTAPSSTGTVWVQGSTHSITWTHNLGSGARVDLDISRDGGSTWTPIASSVASSSSTAGSLSWTVTGPATTQGRIRARWTVNPSVADTSNNNFAIQAATMSVSTPSLWTAGTSNTVNWSSNLPSSSNVRIELSRDSGATWSIVVLSSTPNDGSQSVSVPTSWRTSSSTARLRITSLADPTVVGVSGNFRIF